MLLLTTWTEELHSGAYEGGRHKQTAYHISAVNRRHTIQSTYTGQAAVKGEDER